MRIHLSPVRFYVDLRHKPPESLIFSIEVEGNKITSFHKMPGYNPYGRIYHVEDAPDPSLTGSTAIILTGNTFFTFYSNKPSMEFIVSSNGYRIKNQTMLDIVHQHEMIKDIPSLKMMVSVLEL